MSILRLAIASALAISLAGCGLLHSKPPGPTPSPTLAELYRATFLQHCEVDASSQRANYCECSIDALEAAYPVEKLDAIMRERQMHRAFVAITRRCADSAGLKLR